MVSFRLTKDDPTMGYDNIELYGSAIERDRRFYQLENVSKFAKSNDDNCKEYVIAWTYS